MTDETFGDYLRQVRSTLGLSRKDAVRRAGIAYWRFAKWESNDNRPSDYDTVVKLCDGLGLAPLSEERRTLFWLAGEWIERVEQKEGVPAPRCRKLWGRTELIDEVVGCFQRQDGPRIVLLAAFGGYGKTELARYVAEKQSTVPAFVDVAWVSLKREEFQYTLGTVTVVPPTFELSLAGIVRVLTHRLSCQSEGKVRSRLAQEAILVVIDNLETLLPVDREAVISYVHGLIGNGPSRAMVTSRFDLTAPYLYKPPFPGLSLSASIDLLRDEARHLPRSLQLRNASRETLERIWTLTNGMPLALHMVVGQSQHYELEQVITTLEAARARGSDEAFYSFLCQQAWQELSPHAQALLVFMAVATRAPQTSLQLLGTSPRAGVHFDAATLPRALAELSLWFLVERVETPGYERELAYDLHPLTRGFVLKPETRSQWEHTLHEEDLIATARRKHEEILRLGLGTPPH